MKTVNHTPGPWRVRERNDGDYNVVSDGLDENGNKGWTVCTTAHCYNIEDRKKADARLISYAPTMLEALEHAIRRIPAGHDPDLEDLGEYLYNLVEEITNE